MLRRPCGRWEGSCNHEVIMGSPTDGRLSDQNWLSQALPPIPSHWLQWLHIIRDLSFSPLYLIAIPNSFKASLGFVSDGEMGKLHSDQNPWIHRVSDIYLDINDARNAAIFSFPEYISEAFFRKLLVLSLSGMTSVLLLPSEYFSHSLEFVSE